MQLAVVSRTIVELIFVRMSASHEDISLVGPLQVALGNMGGLIDNGIILVASQ